MNYCILNGVKSTKIKGLLNLFISSDSFQFFLKLQSRPVKAVPGLFPRNRKRRVSVDSVINKHIIKLTILIISQCTI